MSNLDPQPVELHCGGAGDGPGPVCDLLPGAEVALGGARAMTVTRTLPNKSRRMVGAWCFLDRFGPQDVARAGGMRVPPHPHTGLQTVTWLVEGEVLHHDSLGSEQSVRPGELNLMTAGYGISHSERSPADAGPVLDGVQLWTALPDDARHRAPDFAHHTDLPVGDDGGATITVLLGEVAGASSPARSYSPVLGAEIRLDPGASLQLPLDPGFEHAVLVLGGEVSVQGLPLATGPLLYLGRGRRGLALQGSGPDRASAAEPARLLLLGGEPFEEELVMWWNFVARDHEEIVAARQDWTTGDRFGTVHGFDGPPLPAPAMPTTRLRPRGRER
jgi:redox-sensitive bicupin YhaK (pirin superfamily)